MSHKSKIIRINNSVVTVVTIAGFAQILNKSTDTIRRYERENTIPECIFKIGSYRYYPVLLAEKVSKIVATFKGNEKPDPNKVANIHKLFEEERNKYAS